MNFYLTTIDEDNLSIPACTYVDGILIKQDFLNKYPEANKSPYIDYHLNEYIQVILFKKISLFKKQNLVYRISGMDEETAIRICDIVSAKFPGKFDSCLHL